MLAPPFVVTEDDIETIVAGLLAAIDDVFEGEHAGG